MPIIIDTNVLVSRIIYAKRDTAIHRAVNFALQEEVLLFSRETLEELDRVLNRKKFDRYLPRSDRREFFLAVSEVAALTEINQRSTACRDAKDNKFLDVALSGSASAIITGDSDLLVLNPFENIQILTPADFLRTIQN